MTNKTKMIVLSSALGLVVAGVFTLVHTTTDGAWWLSVPATLVAAWATRPASWWMVGRMTNRSEVVATEHGVDGRIEAIEVFWRPG